MKEEIKGDIYVYSLGLKGDIYVYNLWRWQFKLFSQRKKGGNSETSKASNEKPNPNPPCPNPKAPLRSATLSQRPTIPSTQSTKDTKVTPIVNQKLATNISSNKQTNAITTPSKFTNQMEIHNNNPIQQNPEPSPKPRKQSCSPSVTRSPKAEFKQKNRESNFIPYSISLYYECEISMNL